MLIFLSFALSLHTFSYIVQFCALCVVTLPPYIYRQIRVQITPYILLSFALNIAPLLPYYLPFALLLYQKSFNLLYINQLTYFVLSLPPLPRRKFALIDIIFFSLTIN